MHLELDYVLEDQSGLGEVKMGQAVGAVGSLDLVVDTSLEAHHRDLEDREMVGIHSDRLDLLDLQENRLEARNDRLDMVGIGRKVALPVGPPVARQVVHQEVRQREVAEEVVVAVVAVAVGFGSEEDVQTKARTISNCTSYKCLACKGIRNGQKEGNGSVHMGFALSDCTEILHPGYFIIEACVERRK